MSLLPFMYSEIKLLTLHVIWLFNNHEKRGLTETSTGNWW